MPVPTQDAMQGFIASTPRLTFTDTGRARFYARVGCQHWRKEPDGSFTELDPTFHDMAIFGTTAERAYQRLHRGDRFLATGHVHEYEVDADGATETREEFVARRVGHDLARTSYEVQRRQNEPPAVTPAVEQEPGRAVGL